MISDIKFFLFLSKPETKIHGNRSKKKVFSSLNIIITQKLQNTFYNLKLKSKIHFKKIPINTLIIAFIEINKSEINREMDKIIATIKLFNKNFHFYYDLSNNKQTAYLNCTKERQFFSRRSLIL